LQDHEIDHHKLAAPFLSINPEPRDRFESPTIFYVGKATNRGWDDTQDPFGVADERRNETSAFLNGFVEQGTGGSAYWAFAKLLLDATANSNENGGWKRLIWSNIAKIGTIRGNPRGRYFDIQRELAIETMRAEIDAYRPSLVVFTTGDDYAEAVMAATVSIEHWQRDCEEDGYWWYGGSAELPALLWTYHPQGKSSQLLAKWVLRAKSLLDRSPS
jgi:hypothetical protein